MSASARLSVWHGASRGALVDGLEHHRRAHPVHHWHARHLRFVSAGRLVLRRVLRALVEHVDSGRVVVDGTPTVAMTRNELTTLRRNKIGTVFQQPNLLPSLTAVEQLQVIAPLDGHSPRGAATHALMLLDAVGLGDHAHKRPHQLSGGQRQRVNIARALMSNPAVLLVDEPTSALDHERGAAILDLLTTLTHTNGTATVVVTHDRAHLSDMDNVVEIVDGRLLVNAQTR